MEHFTTTMDQTEFCRITQVRTGNRGRRISKGIRTISQRFIFKMKLLFLNCQIINTKWFRAEVQCSCRRTISICLRIALRNHFTMTVQGTKRFISHFVINQTKFTKIPFIIINDHGHPAAFQRTTRPWINITRTFRFYNHSTDQTKRRRITARMVLNHVSTFLLINRNVPLVFLRFTSRNNCARGSSRIRLTCRTDDHCRTIYLKACIFIF